MDTEILGKIQEHEQKRTVLIIIMRKMHFYFDVVWVEFLADFYFIEWISFLFLIIISKTVKEHSVSCC